MSKASISDLSQLNEKQIAIYHAEATRRQKSVGLAYVLLIFFGAIGAHQFYLGRPARGASFLLTFAVGWLFLFAGIGVAMATPTDQDAAAAGGVLVIGWIALFLFGMMAMWDLLTLPRQIRRQDDRMRAKLIDELATGQAAAGHGGQ